MDRHRSDRPGPLRGGRGAGSVRPVGAGGSDLAHVQEVRHRDEGHGRRCQPAGGRGRAADPGGRRQRRRRRGGGAVRPQSRRAAELRHRRRRLPAPLGQPEGRDARRPRDGAAGGKARALSHARRPADEVLRRRGRRTVGGGAGHRAPPRDRPQEMGQAAVEAARRAGDQAGGPRFRDLAAPQRTPRPGAAPGEGPAGQGLFLRSRRQAEGGRHGAEESRLRADPARHRRARVGGVLCGRDRAGRRFDRDRASDQSGRHDARRPQGLSGRGARARLRSVPHLHDLRHGPAEFRGGGGPADPRNPRNQGHDGDEARPGGRSLDRGSRPPRLRGPRALPRGSSIRARAGERAHRFRLHQEPRGPRRSGQVHGQGRARPSALPEDLPVGRLRRHRVRHEPHRRRGQGWSCGRR